MPSRMMCVMTPPLHPHPGFEHPNIGMALVSNIHHNNNNDWDPNFAGRF
jgi:hypothetical protein